MNKAFRRTAVASAVSGIALALGAGQAFGSAFALAEQNSMGLGNAFAGAAATAEDANTIWHNPAGLARLNFPQAEFALNVIVPSAKFQTRTSPVVLFFQSPAAVAISFPSGEIATPRTGRS